MLLDELYDPNYKKRKSSMQSLVNMAHEVE